MVDRRKQAADILAKVPKSGVQSNTSPDSFFNWTGYSHSKMLESWRANKNGPTLLTACGGFASHFAGEMGITDVESFFDLQKSLDKAGKGHAWVPASSGKRPKVGDILRHTTFHVDVAAGWEGDRLVRVAAGQSHHPRPTTNVEGEFDALKWVTGEKAYDPSKLQGWLDIELYFGEAPKPDPNAAWVQGWWKVWDGSFYYYFFRADGVVHYVRTKPANVNAPPAHPEGLGRYKYTAPLLTVTWNPVPGVAAACEENFRNATQGCRQMNADSSLYSPLVATRAL